MRISEWSSDVCSSDLGSLPLSSPPVRAGEPSGRRRRRMGSGTTEQVVRHGGYGAVLQTGPVSGFGSCVKEVRAPRSCGRIDGKPHRVRWPRGPGSPARAGYQDSSRKGVPAAGAGGGIVGKQRESGRHDAGRVSNPSGDPKGYKPSSRTTDVWEKSVEVIFDLRWSRLIKK